MNVWCDFMALGTAVPLFWHPLPGNWEYLKAFLSLVSNTYRFELRIGRREATNDQDTYINFCLSCSFHFNTFPGGITSLLLILVLATDRSDLMRMLLRIRGYRPWMPCMTKHYLSASSIGRPLSILNCLIASHITRWSMNCGIPTKRIDNLKKYGEIKGGAVKIWLPCGTANSWAHLQECLITQ